MKQQMTVVHEEIQYFLELENGSEGVEQVKQLDPNSQSYADDVLEVVPKPLHDLLWEFLNDLGFSNYIFK